jgi:peroxiredoxin
MTAPAAFVVPGVGNAAPDFTLDSTAGVPVTLSAYRGRSHVLVAFFPLAFTNTCTAELCAFSEDFDQFAGRGVEVLPISVDSVPTLREYKAKYDMRVELLSDFKREACRAYGVLNPEKFYAIRSYFLIDRDGILRWSHIEQQGGVKRANAELLAHIEELGAGA